MFSESSVAEGEEGSLIGRDVLGGVKGEADGAGYGTESDA